MPLMVFPSTTGICRIWRFLNNRSAVTKSSWGESVTSFLVIIFEIGTLFFITPEVYQFLE
jgi:hypothetical protein